MIIRTRKILNFDEIEAEIKKYPGGTILLNTNNMPAAFRGLSKSRLEYVILGYDKEDPTKPSFWYSYNNGQTLWAKLGMPNVSIPLQVIMLHLDPDKTDDWKVDQLDSYYTINKQKDTCVRLANLTKAENKFFQEIVLSLGYKWGNDKSSILHSNKKGLVLFFKSKLISFIDENAFGFHVREFLTFDSFWKSLLEVPYVPEIIK